MSIEITRMYHYKNINKISPSKNAILIHGKILDDRSELVINHFKKNLKYELIYNPLKYMLEVKLNNETSFIKNFKIGEDFINKILKYKIFYIDTTSLGFAELLLVLHHMNIAKHKNITIKLLYVEPESYKLKGDNKIYDDEFDLTKQFNDFQKIPPYSVLIDSSSSSKAELIVSLGFENNRLANIIEHDDGARYDKFSPILALPGFVPGWENISLKKHYKELKIFKHIHVSPANNPYETYNVLNKLYNNTRHEHIVIAPIGTKPHTIGIVLFLINKKQEQKNIGIVYDFPEKKEKRTNGIGNIHLYTLKFT